MKMAFYGSSLLSSWLNAPATYYRGLLRDLAGRGYDITFYEPDVFGRQENRDMDSPAWATSVVYPATPEGFRSVIACAEEADVVVKASGVGVFDDELIDGIVEHSRPDAVRIFWDVDAPATLEQMRSDEDHPVRRNLSFLDMVLTSGGGAAVVEAYDSLGAPACTAIYKALDPATNHPVDPNPNYDADLSFLGNRLADREARVEEFLLGPAEMLPARRFLIGGEGWETKSMPANVSHVGNLPTSEINAFNCTPLAVLDLSSESVASGGFSPSARLFESAGAAACVIADAWEGIEGYLKPETEVLVARDGKDVAHYIESLTPVVARAIGEAALRRVLSEHTYSHRGAQVDALLSRKLGIKRSAPPIPPSKVPA